MLILDLPRTLNDPPDIRAMVASIIWNPTGKVWVRSTEKATLPPILQGREYGREKAESDQQRAANRANRERLNSISYA